MSSRAPVPIPYGDDTTWTQPLDTSLLAAHVTQSRAEVSNSYEKGQRLEQLLCWLLAHVPGFCVRTVRKFSADHSQEIDVILWNEQLPRPGIPQFGSTILAECKNWTRRVDSSDVAWFDWKMRLAGVNEGILVAACGVTGRPGRREAAQAILSTANSQRRRILVLTLDEIAGLTSRHDLRELLVGKTMDLVAGSALPGRPTTDGSRHEG
jgi:hypothetical protein